MAKSLDTLNLSRNTWGAVQVTSSKRGPQRLGRARVDIVGEITGTSVSYGPDRMPARLTLTLDTGDRCAWLAIDAHAVKRLRECIAAWDATCATIAAQNASGEA